MLINRGEGRHREGNSFNIKVTDICHLGFLSNDDLIIPIYF